MILYCTLFKYVCVFINRKAGPFAPIASISRQTRINLTAAFGLFSWGPELFQLLWFCEPMTSGSLTSWSHYYHDTLDRFLKHFAAFDIFRNAKKGICWDLQQRLTQNFRNYQQNEWKFAQPSLEFIEILNFPNCDSEQRRNFYVVISKRKQAEGFRKQVITFNMINVIS